MIGVSSKCPGGVEHGVDFAHHHFRHGKSYQPAGYGVQRARTPNPIWIPQPYSALGGVGDGMEDIPLVAKVAIAAVVAYVGYKALK